MSLYKYFHPDRIDVLNNAQIRYSSPDALNDPFEVKPYISGIAVKDSLQSGFDSYLPDALTGEYEKLPREFRGKISLVQFKKMAKNEMPKMHAYLHETHAEILPKIQTKMEETFNKIVGILCLTESPSNLLMWSHYADSHQGFVIEFDSDHSYFDRRLNANDDFRHLRKVIYSENRPSLALSEFKNFEPFLTKGEEWSYEVEWRIMDRLENASTILKEGVNSIYLFKFPKSIIKRIFFGCRMTLEKKSEIYQILGNSIEYKNVICMEAKIDKSTYALTFT